MMTDLQTPHTKSLKSICLKTNGFYYFNDLNPITDFSNQVEYASIIVDTHFPVIIPDTKQFSAPIIQYFNFQEPEIVPEHIETEIFQQYRILYAITASEQKTIDSITTKPIFSHILPYSFDLLKSNYSDYQQYNSFILNFSEKYFDLYYFSFGHFTFANRFYFETKEDVLYYILNVMNQFDLKDNTNKLFFVHRNKEFENYLRVYFTIQNLK